MLSTSRKRVPSRATLSLVVDSSNNMTTKQIIGVAIIFIVALVIAMWSDSSLLSANLIH